MAVSFRWLIIGVDMVRQYRVVLVAFASSHLGCHGVTRISQKDKFTLSSFYGDLLVSDRDNVFGFIDISECGLYILYPILSSNRAEVRTSIAMQSCRKLLEVKALSPTDEYGR